jgi:hypothetical protein
MKYRILSLGVVALTLAGSAALAGVQVSVDWDPFGWWEPPPPVVDAPPRYHAPPAVYYGRGHWGDRRDTRAHHDDRGRPQQQHGVEGQH